MLSTEREVIPEGKVKDFITGALKKATAEEIIRQNIEKSIFYEYGYDTKQIAIDVPIKTKTGNKKASICVYNEIGGMVPKKPENVHILVLVINPEISSKDNNSGVERLKDIMAATSAKFGLWTNSKERVVLSKVEKRFEVEFDDIIDFPIKGQSLEDMEKETNVKLKTAVGYNLLYTFRRCHDYIASNQGLQKQDAFWEFLKLIFCKIHNERNGTSEFRITNKERSINQSLIVKNRIDRLFNDVKKTYSDIFGTNERIELEPRVLNFVVSQMYNYDLLNSSIDVKGAAYEEIVGSNLRGDRGEFFTPRNVVRMAVSMLDPEPGKLVLDPSCGTGGFLIIALKNFMDKIRTETASEPNRLQPLIKKNAINCVFGIDINPSLVRASKMNMVLNNDGQGGLFRANSLENPAMWDKAMQVNISLNKFDYIFTNPPFGAKLPVDDEMILQQFDLAHKWTKIEGRWIMTGGLQRSLPPEVLFIERCIQFLKPGIGKMAIVIPNGILGNPGDEYIRHWILRHCQVLASVSLPVETFLPHVGTQTSVLFLRRKSQEEMMLEEASGRRNEYKVFMAIAEKVGKDRRGNILFKRDENGNEIIIKKKNEFGQFVEEKVIDDDLPKIAEEYTNFLSKMRNN